VEPNAGRRHAFVSVLATGAAVTSCGDFVSARRTLAETPFDLLVTRLRLGAFNGTHLAHLARPRGIRIVVYDSTNDVVLAREVQKAGGFYETVERLPVVLFNYLSPALPPNDRRDPALPDRRALRRGGRRAADISLVTV
jgi:hypothetical protein